MELIIHPSSKSNQYTFKVSDVKDYKLIGNYSIEVEFNNGKKENFYAIDSVEVIESKSPFTLGIQWHFIDNQGFIKSFTVNSGLSPESAEILAGVHTLYSDWHEAYKALEEYNKVFTTFIKA